MPDDTLNLFEAIDEVNILESSLPLSVHRYQTRLTDRQTLHTKWTKVASDSNDLGIHTIKTSLTPALRKMQSFLPPAFTPDIPLHILTDVLKPCVRPT